MIEIGFLSSYLYRVKIHFPCATAGLTCIAITRHITFAFVKKLCGSGDFVSAEAYFAELNTCILEVFAFFEAFLNGQIRRIKIFSFILEHSIFVVLQRVPTRLTYKDIGGHHIRLKYLFHVEPH